jgi:hypothetical protein
MSLDDMVQRSLGLFPLCMMMDTHMVEAMSGAMVVSMADIKRVIASIYTLDLGFW